MRSNNDYPRWASRKVAATLALPSLYSISFKHTGRSTKGPAVRRVQSPCFMLYPHGMNSFVDLHTSFEQPLDQSPLFLTRAGGPPAALAGPTPFRPQGTPALSGCGRGVVAAPSERNGQKAALP